MRVDILKGTKDYYPEEQAQLNYLVDTCKRKFELYGFRPMDTPMIEYFDVLARKYEEGDEILGEIFRLNDRGNRNLGLRYDLSTPLSRFVAMNPHLKKPFRRYQVGKVFRDGPVKTGRLREFYQCDADVVFDNNTETEAELLNLYLDIFNSLEIPVYIEINSYKLLRGLIKEKDFSEKEARDIILSIDKLKKIGKEGVLKEIEEKEFEKERVESIIDLLLENDLEKIEKNNELIDEGVTEIKRLFELVNDERLILNLSLARGLDIYTGTVWEVFDKEQRITSSLGGGGRFNRVISEYMEKEDETPAVGISIGVNAVLEILSKKKAFSIDNIVIPLSKDLVNTAFNVAGNLRKDNSSTEISYFYSIKKGLDYANSQGIKNAYIIGKKEVEEGKITRKNLETGEETKVKISELNKK